MAFEYTVHCVHVLKICFENNRIDDFLTTYCLVLWNLVCFMHTLYQKMIILMYLCEKTIMKIIQCCVQIKEYILVIERTAPPSVFQTCVSPNLSPPALSDSQVVGVYYLVWCTLSILQTEQREVAWAHLWKTLGGALRSITNIYSLIYSNVLKLDFTLRCKLPVYFIE